MSRQSAGPRRALTATLTSSVTVARAMSDAHVRRPPGSGRDRSERDHLHRVIAEAHPLEGDAIDRAVVFTDPAIGAAVVIDQDFSRLAAEFLAEYGVADLDETPARGITALAIDNDVERFLGT